MTEAPYIINCVGKRIDLPIDDPMVAAHLKNPASQIGTLLKQINEDKLYAFAFDQAKHWTFLDIGANIGLVSLYAAAACDRIVAVEPTDQLEVLRRICKSAPQVECVKACLAPHYGTAMFYVCDVNTTAGSMSQTYGVPVPMPCIPLDSLVKDKHLDHVDFCKIDIEGSEVECLTPHIVGKLSTVIGAYYVEVHNCPNSTWEEKLGKLAQTFAHAGYTKMRIRGDAICASTQ